MSAEQSEVIPAAGPSAMAEVSTAVAKFDRVAAGITELRTKYKGVIYDVTTTKGMKDACEARAAIRAPRYEVEKVRRECKAPILALGKEIDSRAARITADLLALEAPVDEVIKREEQRKEDDRKARAETERKRVQAIQDDIENDLRCVPAAMVGRSAAHIEKALLDVVAIAITAERFQEFARTADQVKTLAMDRLRGMLEQQRTHEAEQERVRAEREALARQRLEQEEANRKQRERIAAQEAEAKRKRQAEEAAAAMERKAKLDAELARLRAEREENERISKEQREAAQAEQRRIADENARRAEELRRQQEALEQQRAEVERQQAEVNRLKNTTEVIVPAGALDGVELQQPPGVIQALPAAAKEFEPTANDIINLVASEYGVSFEQALVWCVNAFDETKGEA
jgi:hypothetical protein